MTTLVVVESPAKAKTIEKYLGKHYIVRASMGHLRDLPKSQFGVDVDNNFSPKYINIRGKGELINNLKKVAKTVDKIFIATDPDREGEAIAWHLAFLLGVNPENDCRIEFHEITKSAIQKAVKKPRSINISMVDAQQARRILDRIVGYKLSPLLWKKVKKGLSAGRVQSVAVRLISEREKEIEAFVQEEYWTIAAKLRANSHSRQFEADLISMSGVKVDIKNQEEADKYKARLEQANYVVADVKKKERKRFAQPPFTTSTLQQDAARKLGFTTKKTMMIAQQLYEGLAVGSKGMIGLITYMRTDSTRVAQEAQNEARDFIQENFGAEYIPPKPPIYTNKKSQDAHEAIRPTSLSLAPEKVTKYLTQDQLKLYSLIWARFLASQMVHAVYDTVTVDIHANDALLRASGSVVKFPGFLSVYKEGKEDGDSAEREKNLPELNVGQELKMLSVNSDQHFTQPPPRYTEASLVKTLEEKGIGRPSTYAPIIATILERGYVYKEEKKFRPTDLGNIVIDLLKEYFKNIVDVTFTAGMEDKLDDVAEGKTSHIEVLREFYTPFANTLEKAEVAIGKVEMPEEISDVVCEFCGRNMVVKHGRFGSFLACPGFPECKNTKPILKEIGVLCPLCGGEVIERRTKRGKIFYGCKNYPECQFVTWDKPLQEKCETCGSHLELHKFRKNIVKRCSNTTCSSRSKSTSKEVKKNA